MTVNELKNWTVSEYNEETEDQLDYYINENKCAVGDKAYLYSHAEKELTELEIIHIISRTENMKHYDELIKNENNLIDGEEKYKADTSAEFITNNDCYLVWFKYTK